MLAKSRQTIGKTLANGPIGWLARLATGWVFGAGCVCVCGVWLVGALACSVYPWSLNQAQVQSVYLCHVCCVETTESTTMCFASTRKHHRAQARNEFQDLWLLFRDSGTKQIQQA